MTDTPAHDTASRWLAERADTANSKDIDAHLNLISRQVKLLGIPDFEVIDYENWARQFRHDAENNVLEQVSYDGLNILDSSSEKIVFSTHETVKGTEGAVHSYSLEIVIEKESDGQWRVTQETVLSS